VLVLVIVIALFYSYRIQNSTLVVTVYLDLSVSRESSSRPGFGWILEQNTSVSLVKWPQIATEKTDVNPKYAFNETRTTPVHFVVSFYLNQTNKTVSIPDLTTTGSYSAAVSSFFPSINQGTYNLTITVYVPGFEKEQHQLQRLVRIP
jgi:hypothetical protein